MKIGITGSADMNSAKMSASYRIDGRILLDLPGGALREMRKNGMDPLSFDHLLITHIHGDHMLDLPLLALSKVKSGGKLTVYAPGGILRDLQTLVRLSFPTSFSRERTDGHLFFQEADEFSIGEYSVRRIPVCHGILPHCCGYLVTKDGKTAGFTGDTRLCENVLRMAEVSDLLVCDCDLPRGNEKHMGIPDLITLRKNFPECRILASHLQDETRESLRKENPPGILAAEDGMELSV